MIGCNDSIVLLMCLCDLVGGLVDFVGFDFDLYGFDFGVLFY